MDKLKGKIRGMMKEDIFKQGEMILENLESIERQVRKSLETINIEELENIYIVGCGDSFYSGISTKLFFEKYANVYGEPVEAYEFNAYNSAKLRDKSILIAVSISGQVGTTLDSVLVASEKGLKTIGINATPGSKMYSYADFVVDIGVRVREPGPVPQTYHYLGNLTALYLLGLNIGLNNGTINKDEYDIVKKDIIYNLENIRKNAENLFDDIFENVKKNQIGKEYVIVGSGPNLGTTHFAVAKLVEAAGYGSVFQETEEWGHLQIFITDEETLTLTTIADGIGFDRSKKVLDSMLQLDGEVFVVTDVPEKLNVNAEVFSVISAENEYLSPMTLKLPYEIFAYSVSEITDVRPFKYDNLRVKKVCENTIYDEGISAEEVSRQSK